MNFFKKISTVLLLIILILNATIGAHAADPKKSTAQKEEDKNYAASPAKCGSNAQGETPWNCLFLEEPIGGKVGFDLYITTCSEVKKENSKVKTSAGASQCTTKLWSGGSIPDNAHGPIQAILTAEKDKPYQGPFALLYGYVNLVYDFMSGIIVGVVVLFIVLGGVQMTVSNGDTSAFDAGKNRIIKALVGLLLWFLASLILYTINPTFFAF